MYPGTDFAEIVEAAFESLNIGFQASNSVE